jgi:hypothetical protein
MYERPLDSSIATANLCAMWYGRDGGHPSLGLLPPGELDAELDVDKRHYSKKYARRAQEKRETEVSRAKT